MNICENCGIEFKPGPGSKGRFCSRHCATEFDTKIKRFTCETVYLNNPSKCLNCNSVLSYKQRHNKFCNSSCAAISNNSIRDIESRKKQVATLLVTLKKKGILRPKEVKRKPKLKEKTCVVCGKIFMSKNRKTCSDICHFKSISDKKKGKPGIVRNRAGRGKSGKYKGCWFNSTYELAYYIYCIDHNIRIERNQQCFDYFNPDSITWHKFYPDFRVNGKLVEIKGYKNKLNDYKLSGVTEPIDILYKEDLQEIFTYIQNKTQLKIDKLYHLYEEI